MYEYITAPEPISKAQLKNPSLQYVCLYEFHLIVARQRLGKNVTTVTNTHATIKELLDVSFSIEESGRLVLPRTSCLFSYIML
jgi:hypothetical protein